jgi:uncharacterized protein (TIGR01568 family)
VKQRLAHSGDGDRKEGHGNFSPPPPPPPPFQFQITQQRQKAKSMDKADRQVEVAHSKSKQPPPPAPAPAPPPPLPLPPKRQFKAQSTDDVKGGKKEDASIFPTPQAPYHLKSKSSVLDGSVGVAVVKQSDDPLGDFRRSMVNMIVENRIVTGEELRELLRHFLALNAPRHHEAILAAFTEIWDEAFSARTTTTMATPPRPRPRAPTPPRRRHAPPTRSWR